MQYAYESPWFVLVATLRGISKHNVMGLSAALSFYALFALIPLIVLIFFLISHLVYSSDYAIVKLAILTSNLLPEFSQRIMIEVYNNTQTRAAWGLVGFLVLLWTITPLAAHMRSSFYLIASRRDVPSFWNKQIRDVIAVLGVLMVFFLFTAAGFILESVILFLATHLPASLITVMGGLLSLLLTTTLIAGFYHAFCPLNINWRHLIFSAMVTATLWMLMRPAFGLFLSINKNYGAIFGSMKAMFVSISWLYLNFAVFLIGIELMVTLRQKDVLLLKGLFDDLPNQQHYLHALLRRYGKTYTQNAVVFQQGGSGRHYYMVLEGTVQLVRREESGTLQPLRILQNGDFFGEIALFSSQPAIASAIVTSSHATLIEIYAEYMDDLLQEDPKIAVRLLKQLSDNVQINPALIN
ncbi:YhjD/YihY/BrkB family envelope integrity protein [Methylophilus aquaticus]|uniref:YhjD/YihY/BrkB family envelope integrity protein n=1 Tax=Methylophilus aquaticus TaxID=1971610 RepID=A0ABT9JSE0_9PROT|nr:YhjD/YihY/BrkB family envelope integrity protein [Methylophilus aquaticus]MDP8567480.1 YhjD/YihY/BrkB family envelope integrity protein [Methylophilus aquaticus]